MTRLEERGTVHESSSLSIKQTNPHAEALTSKETHACLVLLSPSLISHAALLGIRLMSSTDPVIQHGHFHDFLNNNISSNSLVMHVVKWRKKASSANRNRI